MKKGRKSKRSSEKLLRSSVSELLALQRSYDEMERFFGDLVVMLFSKEGKEHRFLESEFEFASPIYERVYALMDENESLKAELDELKGKD